MQNNIFSIRDDEKQQIDALKKVIRIYFNGDLKYNERVDFLNFDFENDPNLVEILKSFDCRYTESDLTNLTRDITLTAVSHEDKLVFIYDGANKFTQDRKQTLLHYPEDLKLGFPIEFWIDKCDKLNSKSVVSLPVALMDSMVDIGSSKSGYMVIRIKHNEFDWREKGAMDRLTRLVENSKIGTFNLN